MRPSYLPRAKCDGWRASTTDQSNHGGVLASDRPGMAAPTGARMPSSARSCWHLRVNEGVRAPIMAMLVLFMLCCPFLASASTRGLYVGNEFYAPTTTWQNNAKYSGFTTLFLFTLHIGTDGSIRYNDTVVVTNCVYVGDTTWAAKLAACKTAPSSVNRIELCIGCWGTESFNNIRSLVATNGTGPNSILYKSFLALKNATGVDAIQYDDETTYDVSSSVAFGNMIAAMGMKVTFCPYTAQSYWVNTKAQLGDKVDAIYLQCYDGGAGNNPATWINAFGGFKVQPGLWGNVDSTAAVTTKMRNWVNTLGITGGFMWLNGSMPMDAPKWALALKNGLDPLPPAPPTNVLATAGGASVVVSWTAVAGVTSYNVKRSISTSGSYTTVASAVTNTCFLDKTAYEGQTWYYRVSAIGEGGEGTNSAPVSAQPCGQTLPEGWTCQNIGSGGLAGNASGCGSSFVVQGGGTEIGGAADSFTFVSMEDGTNGAVMARLVAFKAGDSGAAAGVMYRNDSSSDSMYVGVCLTASNSLSLRWRNAAGGQTVSTTPVSGVTAPVFLQLLRKGSTFSGYYAVDGVNWKLLGSISVGLNENAFSGLAVTAHAAGNLALAAFDTFSGGWPTIVQQPDPTSLTRFVGSDVSISVGVNAVQPVLYCWNRDGAVISSSTNPTLTITDVTASSAGNYTVIASNAFGSVTSTVVSLAVLSTSNMPYAQAVLSDDPINYWRLNESSGTVAYDYVGGNHGTYTNVSLNQAGYVLLDTRKSARFGLMAGSYVRILPMDFATSGNASFSVEAWVNGAAQTNDCGLITKGAGGGGEQFNLDCGGPNHSFRFFVRDAGGGARLATSSALPDNAWHHLVGVCDQINGKVILYVDGTNAAQGSITPGAGLLASSSPMTIGARQSGPATAYDLQFVGRMEDVAVYDSALSAAQVQAHFATATNRPPVFASNPLTVPSAKAGAAYSASIATSASDPNGDMIVYAKVSGPSWLFVSGSGSLSGTPANSDAGTNSFVISAKDAPGLTTTVTLLLNVNGAPTFASDPVVLSGATAGHAYSGTLATCASDPNGDLLTFAKLSGPSWLKIATNGDISGTPTTGDVGVGIFQVSVIDSGGLSGSAAMNVPVASALSMDPVLTMSGGTIFLGWSGGVGPYQVQVTTNLLDPVWQDLGAPVSSTSFSISPTNTPSFYRIIGR